MPQRRKGTNTESRLTWRRKKGQPQRGKLYKEEGHTTYTEKRDTWGLKWKGDTHGEETHGKERKETTCTEKGHIERGQPRRGDSMRKELHGEGTHTKKGYTKKRLYREVATWEGDYAERVKWRRDYTGRGLHGEKTTREGD